MFGQLQQCAAQNRRTNCVKLKTVTGNFAAGKFTAGNFAAVYFAAINFYSLFCSLKLVPRV